MNTNIEQQVKSEIVTLNNKITDIRTIIKRYPNDILNDKVGAIKVDNILKDCLVHFERMELLMDSLNSMDYTLLLGATVKLWNNQNTSIAEWKQTFENTYCYLKRGVEDFL